MLSRSSAALIATVGLLGASGSLAGCSFNERGSPPLAMRPDLPTGVGDGPTGSRDGPTTRLDGPNARPDGPTTKPDGPATKRDSAVPRPDLPQIVPDTAPPPDTAPTPDTAPPPDTAPSPDTTAPPLIDESFASGTGVVSAIRGSWSVGGGRVRQSLTSPNGATLSASVSAADYSVETVVRIHRIRGISGVTEGAGVAARIQPLKGSQHASKPREMYACFAIADFDQLDLYKASGTNNYFTGLRSTNIKIDLNTPYRVRITVIGNKITCELVDRGIKVTYTDSSPITSAGRAGLVTAFADASFDYLLVKAAP